MKHLFTRLIPLLCAVFVTVPTWAFTAEPDVGDEPSMESFSPAIYDAPVENESADIGTLTEPDTDYPAPLSEEWLARQNMVQGTGTVSDLEKYWATVGWPDDVSYVCCSGGMMEGDTIYHFWEIGLVDADKNRRQEILSLSGSNCLITFFDCSYSYTQRQAAADAILALNDPNIEQVVLGKNTEYVFIDLSENADADEYQRRLSSDFGALIQVTEFAYNYTDNKSGGILPVIPGGGTEIDIGGTPTNEIGAVIPTSPAPLWPISVLLLAAVLSFGFLSLRRRHVSAVQTSIGTVSVSSAPLSHSQVEKAIREDLHTPSPQTLERIKMKLN